MIGKEGKPTYTPEQMGKLQDQRVFADARAIKVGAGHIGEVLFFEDAQKKVAREEMVESGVQLFQRALYGHLKDSGDVAQVSTKQDALNLVYEIKYYEAIKPDDARIQNIKQSIGSKTADPVYKGEYDAVTDLVSSFENKLCGGSDPTLTQERFYSNFGAITANYIILRPESILEDKGK
jgi:hypothetical protein